MVITVFLESFNVPFYPRTFNRISLEMLAIDPNVTWVKNTGTNRRSNLQMSTINHSKCKLIALRTPTE